MNERDRAKREKRPWLYDDSWQYVLSWKLRWMLATVFSIATVIITAIVLLSWAGSEVGCDQKAQINGYADGDYRLWAGECQYEGQEFRGKTLQIRGTN